MAEKKVPWWKKCFAWLLDSEWDLDPYKIAAFLLVWQFASVTQKVLVMADAGADIGHIGVVSALLLPITTMITFLFNYSKENDQKLLGAARE
jgi:hypothetical protein